MPRKIREKHRSKASGAGREGIVTVCTHSRMIRGATTNAARRKLTVPPPDQKIKIAITGQSRLRVAKKWRVIQQV